MVSSQSIEDPEALHREQGDELAPDEAQALIASQMKPKEAPELDKEQGTEFIRGLMKPRPEQPGVVKRFVGRGFERAGQAMEATGGMLDYIQRGGIERVIPTMLGMELPPQDRALDTQGPLGPESVLLQKEGRRFQAAGQELRPPGTKEGIPEGLVDLGVPIAAEIANPALGAAAFGFTFGAPSYLETLKKTGSQDKAVLSGLGDAAIAQLGNVGLAQPIVGILSKFKTPAEKKAFSLFTLLYDTTKGLALTNGMMAAQTGLSDTLANALSDADRETLADVSRALRDPVFGSIGAFLGGLGAFARPSRESKLSGFRTVETAPGEGIQTASKAIQTPSTPSAEGAPSGIGGAAPSEADRRFAERFLAGQRKGPDYTKVPLGAPDLRAESMQAAQEAEAAAGRQPAQRAPEKKLYYPITAGPEITAPLADRAGFRELGDRLTEIARKHKIPYREQKRVFDRLDRMMNEAEEITPPKKFLQETLDDWGKKGLVPKPELRDVEAPPQKLSPNQQRNVAVDKLRTIAKVVGAPDDEIDRIQHLMGVVPDELIEQEFLDQARELRDRNKVDFPPLEAGPNAAMEVKDRKAEEAASLKAEKEKLAAAPEEGTKPGEIPLVTGKRFASALVHEGERVGTVNGMVQKEAVHVMTTTIAENARGKGLASKAYERLAQRALATGRELWSDTVVTEDAARLYDSLKRKGYTVEKSPEAKFHPETTEQGIHQPGAWIAPGPVFRVTEAPKRGELLQFPPSEPGARMEVSPEPKRPRTIREIQKEEGLVYKEAKKKAEGEHAAAQPKVEPKEDAGSRALSRLKAGAKAIGATDEELKAASARVAGKYRVASQEYERRLNEELDKMYEARGLKRPAHMPEAPEPEPEPTAVEPVKGETTHGELLKEIEQNELEHKLFSRALPKYDKLTGTWVLRTKDGGVLRADGKEEWDSWQQAVAARDNEIKRLREANRFLAARRGTTPWRIWQNWLDAGTPGTMDDMVDSLRNAPNATPELKEKLDVYKEALAKRHGNPGSRAVSDAWIDVKDEMERIEKEQGGTKVHPWAPANTPWRIWQNWLGAGPGDLNDLVDSLQKAPHVTPDLKRLLDIYRETLTKGGRADAWVDVRKEMEKIEKDVGGPTNLSFGINLEPGARMEIQRAPKDPAGEETLGFISKIPLLRGEERLTKESLKEGVRSVGRAAKRMFYTPHGEKPGSAARIEERAKGEREARAQGVERAKSIAVRALKRYNKDFPQLPVLNEDIEAALTDQTGKSMEALPPEVRPHIQAWRDKIDAQSRELIDGGMTSETKREIMLSRLGEYLHGSHRAFKDPKWAQKIPPDVRNRLEEVLLDWSRAPDPERIKDLRRQAYTSNYRSILRRRAELRERIRLLDPAQQRQDMRKVIRSLPKGSQKRLMYEAALKGLKGVVMSAQQKELRRQFQEERRLLKTRMQQRSLAGRKALYELQERRRLHGEMKKLVEAHGDQAAEAEMLGQIRAEMEKMLVDAKKVAENPWAAYATSNLRRQDLTIMRPRTGMPKEMHAFLGEEHDPATRFAHTMLKQAEWIATFRKLKELRSAGLAEGWLHEKETVKDGVHYTYKVSSANNPRLKPLIGDKELYTTEEIAKALFLPTINTTGPGWKWAVWANALLKATKTIYQPFGVARQFWGQITPLVRNGWANHAVANGARIAKTLYSDDPKYRAARAELLKLRLLEESIAAQEYRDISETMGAREMNAPYKHIKGFSDWMGEVFSRPDNFTKIVGFEVEKDWFERAGYSEAQASEMAADLVRNLTPTYSRIAPEIQKWRHQPILGTFMAFKSEQIRNAVQLAKQIDSELHSDNEVIRERGRQRAATTIAGVSVAPVGALAWNMLSGVDQDQDERKRGRASEYDEQRNLVWLGEDSYADLSDLDDTSWLTDPIVRMLRGERWDKIGKEMLNENVAPFFEPSLLSQTLWQFANGRDKYGKPLGELPSRMAWLGKQFVPTGITNPTPGRLSGLGIRPLQRQRKEAGRF